MGYMLRANIAFLHLLVRYDPAEMHLCALDAIPVLGRGRPRRWSYLYDEFSDPGWYLAAQNRESWVDFVDSWGRKILGAVGIAPHHSSLKVKLRNAKANIRARMAD